MVTRELHSQHRLSSCTYSVAPTFRVRFKIVNFAEVLECKVIINHTTSLSAIFIRLFLDTYTSVLHVFHKLACISVHLLVHRALDQDAVYNVAREDHQTHVKISIRF